MQKLSLSALLILAAAASASTPEAWEQMNTRVNRACIAMSGLAHPELLARKISFSDAIGVEVRMIRGVDKRGHMQRLLCAYNRSTGRTEVQEADVWAGPVTQPSGDRHSPPAKAFALPLPRSLQRLQDGKRK